MATLSLSLMPPEEDGRVSGPFEVARDSMKTLLSQFHTLLFSVMMI